MTEDRKVRHSLTLSAEAWAALVALAAADGRSVSNMVERLALEETARRRPLDAPWKDRTPRP